MMMAIVSNADREADVMLKWGPMLRSMVNPCHTKKHSHALQHGFVEALRCKYGEQRCEVLCCR